MSSGRLIVVYVAGADRSGSTLLGRLLGQAYQAPSPGELNLVWRRGIVQNDECGCGRTFRQCKYWGRLAARPPLNLTQPHAMELDRHLREFFRLRHLVQYRRNPEFARSTWRHLRATAYIDALYHTLADSMTSDILIDISKRPKYLMMLGALESIDLRVIHLVRDSRAVAYSFERIRKSSAQGEAYPGDVSYGMVRHACSWLLDNAATEVVARGQAPYMLVRYEDLVRDPGRVINSLSDAIGRKPSAPLPAPGACIDFAGSHMLSGNPVRKNRHGVPIAPDLAWQTEMGGRDRRLVLSLTAPLLARYGYLRCREQAVRMRTEGGHLPRRRG